MQRYRSINMTLKLLFLWILNTLFIGSVTAMAFRTVPLHGGNTSNPAISSTCALCRPRYSLDGGSCYDPVKEICCDGKIYNIERTPSLRCCGDTPYMPDTHSCCGPLTTDQYRIITSSSEICCSDSEGVAWVHSVIGKGRVMCCGGKAFDSDKKICCKGHLHMNTSSSRCCGHRTYSSETHMCCNKKIIRIRNGRAHCCASTVYNPPREACCNGQVVIGHNKENVSNDETCQDLSQRTVASLPERLDLPCGNDTYDPLHELCCDGVPHYMDAGDTERVSCCGRQTFRPETDLCCNGVVFLGSDELDITNRRCCGIQTILVYNSKLQMCCDEQIYNKHSSGCDGLTKDIFVSIGGLDYNGCGTSMDNSCRTIAYAWLLLKYGDTLKIDGRNSENNPYKVCASFDGFGLTCNKSITIQGTNSPAYISGGNRCNVFSFYGIPSTKPISVTLSGLTFVNISALTYDNGAISAIGVNLHVFDCVFSNTQDGYAVWYEPGSVILNANMCLKINISRFLNNFGGLRIVLPKSNSSNNSTVSVMVSNTFFQDNTRYGSLVLTNIGSVNLTVEATKVQISRSANELGGALHLGPLQTDGPMPTQTPSLQDNMFQEMDSNDDGYVSVIKETHNMEIDYNIRSYIFFNDCIFNHNNAREMGGAIYADTPDFSELIFSNMSILHNSVSNTFKTGKGGGIYLNGGHVTFLNVTMVDNNATFLGGSVYNDIDTKILEIIDSSFETRVQGDQSSSQNGELLFSISNIIDISNSSFIVTSASLTNITAVFISAKLNYTIDSETLIRCDSGYNIAIDSVCKNGGTISSFNCIPCSKSTYSFDHGYSSGWEVYPIDCLPCPKGGDCEHAHVHARPGQWGYQDNTSLISKAIFQPCPSGYCCDNHDQHECPSFNSCPRNRTGILCRRCKDEYYNVLGSTACVHISDCSKEQAIWQIILLILGVLLFYLFLLFKSELTEFIYQTYIMKIKSEKKNDSDDDGGDISPSHSSEPSIKNDEYKRPWLREHGLPWQSSDDYVKIVFLFYQVVDLLIVEDTSFPRSHISSVQIFVVKLFNFQMVPPFLTTCVDNNSKVFLNSWQYELLLFLWVIVGSKYVFGSVVCRECSIRCTKCPRKVSRFNSRITKAYMQILILGYVVLLKRLLKRIHTTEINNKPETTYDPTVESWEWVWYTSVVYVFTALFPFCVVVSLGAYLLEKKYIGVSQYLLACIFPLPFIPVWLYCYYCAHGKTSKDYIKMDDNGHSYPILEVLQSPFKVGSRYWESVFLFTKLVLVWCNVYILNAFLQSLVMVSICAILVCVHAVLQPFYSKRTNHMQILSLVLLVLIAGISCLERVQRLFFIRFAEPHGTIDTALELTQFILILFPIGLVVLSVVLFLFLRCLNCVQCTKSDDVPHPVSLNSVLEHSTRQSSKHQSTQNDISQIAPTDTIEKLNAERSNPITSLKHRTNMKSPAMAIDSGIGSGFVPSRNKSTMPFETVFEDCANNKSGSSVPYDDILLDRGESGIMALPLESGAQKQTVVDIHLPLPKNDRAESPLSLQCPSEVYNWKEDHAYDLSCIAQFNNIVNQLPDRSVLSSTNFTTNTFAAGQFNYEGGHLSIELSGINLFIPPGALSEDDEPQNIHISVSLVDREYHRLGANETALSPVIRIGPHGRKFRKNILLSVKHNLGAGVTPGKLKLWASDTDMKHSTHWYNVSEKGRVFCISQGEDSISFIDTLSMYTVICDVNQMKFRIGAFITRLNIASSKLRVRVWRDTAADLELVNVKELALRGKKIGNDSGFVLSKNGKGLNIKMEKLCDGHRTLDGTGKVIPNVAIWQQCNGIGPCPSATFLIVDSTYKDQPEATCSVQTLNLSCHLKVYDDTGEHLITTLDIKENNDDAFVT